MGDALVKVPEKEMAGILAVAYKGTIMTMQWYLFPRYAVVSPMWSNYNRLRQNGLDPANFLGWHRKPFNIAAGKEKGHPKEDTIALLHG